MLVAFLAIFFLLLLCNIAYYTSTPLSYRKRKEKIIEKPIQKPSENEKKIEEKEEEEDNLTYMVKFNDIYIEKKIKKE